jgi:hypothetical protein
LRKCEVSEIEIVECEPYIPIPIYAVSRGKGPIMQQA